jgi:hypothetical protein
MVPIIWLGSQERLTPGVVIAEVTFLQLSIYPAAT